MGWMAEDRGFDRSFASKRRNVWAGVMGRRRISSSIILCIIGLVCYLCLSTDPQAAQQRPAELLTLSTRRQAIAFLEKSLSDQEYPQLKPTTSIFDRIIVINLASRTDRRARMNLMAQEHGFNFSYITPLDPHRPAQAEVLQRLYPHEARPTRGKSGGRDVMNDAEISLFHAFKSALSQAREDALQSILVLEDDVDIEYDFSYRLRQMGRHVFKTSWDMWYLGHCYGEEWRKPATHHPSLHIAYKPLCTHAMAFHARGIAKILQAFEENGPGILDDTISSLVQSKKLKAFSTEPNIVTQIKRGYEDSDIRPGENRDQEKPLVESTLGALVDRGLIDPWKATVIDHVVAEEPVGSWAGQKLSKKVHWDLD